MKTRFKLTIGFLAASVAIFAVAATVITQSARRTEESALIDLVSEQSGRDAHVIAGVVTGMALGPGTPESGFASPSDAQSGFNGLAMSTFLRNSNIVRLSLYQVDGSLIWSSVDTAPRKIGSSNRAFSESVLGATVTGLLKDTEFTSPEGATVSGDLTATYVPLVNSTTLDTGQVLEVTRDVTAALQTRIEAAQTSMFKSVFSTLGGAFVVLLGIVLTSDILIRRSQSRAVAQERALLNEKLVANRLELENQQLRQMNEERDRFLSMVSHELRTPLTTIMGFTDVLRRRQVGEQRDRNLQHLDLMRKNGEHLNSLIEELLEITRIQAGKFEIVKEGFMLDHLLQQVEESAKVMLRPKQQILLVDKDIDGVELYGDRRRVMQVLLNLLSNASKYSPVGSTITLKVLQRGESVQMSVGDEGRGIPEDDQNLVFERFHRRDDATTRSESGLGLGLAIVKAIVAAHRGAVAIESSTQAGTVMTVTLPGARKSSQQTSMALSPEAQFEIERLERLRDLRSVPISARSVS